MDIRILSLNSDKIYESNYVNCSYTIDNIDYYFKSLLEDSLDLRHLLTIKDFKYFSLNDLFYSYQIINVKFDYVYKDDNITKSKKDLRKELYDNGFKLKINYKNKIKEIEYIRFKRSSGSSRVGRCLFIDKKLYSKMNKWSLCGLNEKNKKIKSDIVSFEAYKALSLSGIIDTINIEPKNILLVDDFEYTFETDCISVEKNNNGKVVAIDKKVNVTNNIWDGEGLLDESLFQGKYKENGMMYLRNRFFKGCVFNTRLQEFLKDKTIDDLNGETIATDIKDIKMVITKSCLKYLKFGSFKDWLDNVGSEYGIVKVDEPTHFFKGNMVMTTYQFINTLRLTKQDIEELAKDEVKYLEYLRNDPDILRFHLNINNKKEEKLEEDDDDEIEDYNTMHIKSLITRKLLLINPDFYKSTMYYNFVSDIINSFLDKMRKGKILINGTYAYLFGNGYELLLNTIKNNFDKNNPKSIIEENTVMTTFYDPNEKLTGSRNPHITMGNILTATNKHYPEYEKWFHLSKQIICVNAIGENIQQRLNGCDYDSDSLLITNNKFLFTRADVSNKFFKVPVCGLDKVNTNKTDLAEIDYDIQMSQIGPIVNLSQRLNSIYWHNLNNGKSTKGIYEDICILAVLSGTEIDKAKRNYGINSISILNGLIKKYDENYKTLPMIFSVTKSKKSKSKRKFEYYDTAIDYLIKHNQNIKIYKKGKESSRKELVELLNDIPNPAGQNYKNKELVIPIIKKAHKNIDDLKNNAKMDEGISKYQLYIEIKNEYKKALKKIGRKLDNEKNIKLVIKELYDTKQQILFWDTLYYLLIKDKSVFNRCFKRKGVTFEFFPRLLEDKNGDIKIFNVSYKKDYPVAKAIEDENGDTMILGKRYIVIYKYKNIENTKKTNETKD